MPSVRYRIEHETTYSHADRALASWHVAHLLPRTLPRQRVLSHSVTADPAPTEWSERDDCYGNAVQQFGVTAPYTTLRVTSRSVVEIEDAVTIDADATTPWEEARDALRFVGGRPADAAAEFSVGSPYASPALELADFGREIFTRQRPLAAAAIDLMHRIHSEFRFDPGATSITTPVTRVLSLRHGVCQDFAHVGIACLRALGLAARYVSGYLLTDPPPGQPRLVGADASHAWLAVYCPGSGWIDLDPTNDVIPGLRHVTLGWGRDYADVSPLRGVVLGGGEHALHVGVSVVPIEPEVEPVPS
jgi:transglutaminase-like putative cysteine protease